MYVLVPYCTEYRISCPDAAMPLSILVRSPRDLWTLKTQIVSLPRPQYRITAVGIKSGMSYAPMQLNCVEQVYYSTVLSTYRTVILH